EFLGTLVCDSSGRSKVVHYWRMEAGGAQVRELTNDVRAVEWLPLEAAVARLSRGYERVFLENVGPMAVSAMTRQLQPKAKRREAAVAEPQLPFAESVSTEPEPPAGMAEPDEIVDIADGAVAEETQHDSDGTMPPRHQRASFAERVRNWLGGDP